MAYQKDISAILGISISTVSKALKGYPDISEETRQKVLKTAEDLEYRFQKRGGVNGAAHVSGAVGLVVPELGRMLESGYYRGMLLGMTQEAAKEKRDLVIMGAESASNGMSWGVRSIARRVDGLCIVAREEDFFRGRFAQILETNFPVVSIEHGPAGHIAVGSGRRQNIHMLLTYLKSMGHRQIAMITGLGHESKRMAAILRAEAENLAMSVREVETGSLASIEASGQLEALKASCVVFGTYREAELAVQRWKEAGWDVPGDVSAAALEGPWGGENDKTGNDENDKTGNGENDKTGDGENDKTGNGMAVRITCVQTNPREIGREAIRRLIEITEHPERDSGERVHVLGELCAGETVNAIVRNPLEKFE